jgi:hypothetical protein
MKHFLFVMFVGGLMGWSSFSQAAISTKAVRPKIGVILSRAGSVHGGEAREMISLLNVKRQISKNHKIERLEFAMGNAGQRFLKGKPGYFNLELRPGKKQIVIGFAQTLNTKFEERELRRILASSRYVKSSEMFFDPHSQSMNVILNLRQPASVRVIPVAGGQKKTARLVVDLFEAAKR